MWPWEMQVDAGEREESCQNQPVAPPFSSSSSTPYSVQVAMVAKTRLQEQQSACSGELVNLPGG